jgi:hypothetical protein
VRAVGRVGRVGSAERCGSGVRCEPHVEFRDAPKLVRRIECTCMSGTCVMQSTGTAGFLCGSTVLTASHLQFIAGSTGGSIGTVTGPVGQLTMSGTGGPTPFSLFGVTGIMNLTLIGVLLNAGSSLAVLTLGLSVQTRACSIVVTGSASVWLDALDLSTPLSITSASGSVPIWRATAPALYSVSVW